MSDLTFGNLITLKSQLGYGVRDYLYYKRRCGDGVATLKEIDYDIDVDLMVQCNMDEREVRLLLTKDQVTERDVVITPIKSSKTTSIEEEYEDELLDAYKDWLSYMHHQDQAMELQDTYRQDTVDTYKEWLTVEGKLDQINAYVNCTTQINSVHSSQDRNQAPPAQRPSHARRIKEQGNSSENRNKRGRGTLKGLKATNKRIKEGSQKLKVEFSKLGGPRGDNSRSFIDEIVMFTRKRAPLIGVKVWRDIDLEVKNSIVSDVLARWDLENTDDTRTKILSIAKERYKGWRSTFSATYRAFNSYDERMRHKPEDLDIVEWHYLVKYFGTEKFQRTSNKNSHNRALKKTQHLTGSKPFSQCSYEQQDPDTGEEPNDLELWMLTHGKEGVWTNQASRDVYEKASSLISDRISTAEDNFVTQKDRNEIFQKAYREVTECKSTKLHGNGYMAVQPTRRQLLSQDYNEQVRREEILHREHVELMDAFGKLQEKLESEEADREAERAEHRRQIEEMKKAREDDKEALRQEFLAMLKASQAQPALQEATNDRTESAEVAAATNINDGNENTTHHEVSSPL
ncbi:hypothetical protein ACP70R_028167 [Stipagrostis hirtigluma subsp. patula]